MKRIGLTEHRAISEQMKLNPPSGFEYEFVNPLKLSFFEGGGIKVFEPDVDLVEANDFPCFTSKDWVYNCFNPALCYSFSMYGSGFSVSTKKEIMNRVLLKDNFKKLIFTNQKALELASEKPYDLPKDLIDKSTVIYPGISHMDKVADQNSSNINILMVGGIFLNKGGINVVDAFIKLKEKFDNIHLTLASEIDNSPLGKTYLEKIKKNNIQLKYYKRDELYKDYPNYHIMVLPTLTESGFPYALVEAQAFGLVPVATNISAISEVMDGILLDRAEKTDYNSDKYNSFMTGQVYDALYKLIDDDGFRRDLARKALSRAKSQFSFSEKNKKVKAVYEQIW